MRSILTKERTTLLCATLTCDVGRTELLVGAPARGALVLLAVFAACDSAFKAVSYLRQDRR